MKLKINSCTDKTLEQYGRVKNVNVTDLTGLTFDASIFEKQKDGTNFPNFDAIVVGAEIEANPWLSPKTSKYSIYPPKITPQGSFAPKKGNIAAIEKNMETKAENIKVAQENKEQSIRIASTMSGAVQLAIAEKGQKELTSTEIEAMIIRWRSFLWNRWDKVDNEPPF